ncbi:heme peroxidase [Lindgomyces ingoldianus]|uniref:Heme peroxidase n=1 Tax=Lindgomyces ingoldianus TaxID=673940 RepID=A0ACB6QBZ0_9PLEO|nr:heme peroxidase [Lindgomyces ingoldianus]KAF2464488.1 heme peroxidase [Lindgomyces ingoldianus]
MKSLLFLSGYALITYLPSSIAYPGMKDSLSDLHRAANVPRADAKQLIGDLKTLKDTQLTTIGKDIKAIILGTKDARSNTIDTSVPPGTVDSAACKADLCCVWKWISYEMTARFNGTSGRCTKLARGAVRLGFHDAAVWSNTTTYGGADGSILLTDEISRSDNNGLSAIGDQMKTWYNKYHQYGVSMADLIQMGANIATVVCPLGPRIRSFVGRKDNAKAGPTALIPDVADSADKIIKLFAAKTIDVHDLVALVGAHTTSQQHFVDTSRDGDPQDSTPGVWDVAFYGQTTGSPPPRVLKFASDVKLSQDTRAKTEWQQFIGAQSHWNEDYAKAYTRLSLLGVNNINDLKECTQVLPPERTAFVNEDQVVLDMWLQGQFNQLNNMVDDAIMLTGIITTNP